MSNGTGADEVVNNIIGKDHHPLPKSQAEERHLGLTAATQKAVRDLVFALEQNGEGWQSEREGWAKERAALEASVAYEEGRADALKKETKRLARVVRETKHESERLALEASRLREENASLLARNARLDSRNLQVRREIETVSERNRKLLSTLQRELQGNVNSDSAEASGGRRAAVAGVDWKSSAPATSSVKLGENAHSRSGRDSDGASGQVTGKGCDSSDLFTSQRRRRRRQFMRSDTEEIVTPRSTAPTEQDEPAASAAAAVTQGKHNANNGARTAAQGGRWFAGGWRLATEAVEATHAARQEAGAPPPPPPLPPPPPPQQGCSDGDQSSRREKGVSDEPGTEGEGVMALGTKKDKTGSSRNAEAVSGDQSSRRPSPADAAAAGGAAASTSAARPDEAVQVHNADPVWVDEKKRVESDGGGRASEARSSCSATLSVSAPVLKDAGHRKASPLPPPQRPPTQGKRTAFSPLATSKPPASSFTAGRKRSRLSLGGMANDKAAPLAGHSVEITEVLEGPRPRSAARSLQESWLGAKLAAAGAKACARQASSETLPWRLQDPAPDGPLAGQAAGGARGRASPDGSTARAGLRASHARILSFPGPVSAAERMGSSSGGTGRMLGSGDVSGGDRRVTQHTGVVGDQRGPGGHTPGHQHKHQQKHKQKQRPSRHGPKGFGKSSMDVSRKTPDDGEGHAGNDGRDVVVAPGDHGQPGPREGGSGGGGGPDSGTSAAAAHDAIYPRLKMAAVNSPAKKKPRARRRRQQQQDHHHHRHHLPQRPQEDAPEPLPASSLDPRGCDRLGDGPAASSSAPASAAATPAAAAAAAAAATAADSGRGRDERGRQATPSGVDKGVDRDDKWTEGAGAERGVRADGDAAEERENSPAPDHSRGPGVDGHRREATPDAHARSPTKCVVGGGERTAAAAAAKPAARHPDVVNPYATAMNGKAGSSTAGGGGSGGRMRESRPGIGYKFQEVVRDRGKRAMMKGHDCEHCSAYLAAVGGSPGEREAMLNLCSRHKYTEENGRPALTPDGFWDLSFADSPQSDKGVQRRRTGDGDGGGGGQQLAGGAEHDSLDF
eukprot:g18646.t1